MLRPPMSYHFEITDPDGLVHTFVTQGMPKEDTVSCSCGEDHPYHAVFGIIMLGRYNGRACCVNLTRFKDDVTDKSRPMELIIPEYDEAFAEQYVLKQLSPLWSGPPYPFSVPCTKDGAEETLFVDECALMFYKGVHTNKQHAVFGHPYVTHNMPSEDDRRLEFIDR